MPGTEPDLLASYEPYWLQDPGHGWLVVKKEAVRNAADAGGFVPTEYSYFSPMRDVAYLEEDVDAPGLLRVYYESLGHAAPHFPVRQINDFDDYRRRHGLVRYPDHE